MHLGQLKCAFRRLLAQVRSPQSFRALHATNFVVFVAFTAFVRLPFLPPQLSSPPRSP